MVSTTTYRLAALIAVVHSFTQVSALAAADPQITQAPTPTLARRGDVAGAPGTPILSTLKYDYTALPQQVYPFAVLRGPQFGFNKCDASTLGPNSNCQTLVFNGPDDFCLWGSPDANGSIGDVEAKVVAYCTKPYHGTRVIPPGSITGLQWMETPGYIQVSGFIKNGGIGLSPDDQGGELDPHGADLQGNPLGGVVYSNGTKDSDGHTLTQVMNWNTFVGGGSFCFKACFNNMPAGTPDYCENRYDLLGCGYNMPSSAQDGQFSSCQGDVQDVVGVYTSAGQTITWQMPDPLTTDPPYTPRIPASSSCTTYQSADLFDFVGAAAPTPATTSNTAATTTAATTAATGTAAAVGTTPKTGGTTGPAGPAATTKAATTGTAGTNGTTSADASKSNDKSSAMGLAVPYVALLLLGGGALLI